MYWWNIFVCFICIYVYIVSDLVKGFELDNMNNINNDDHNNGNNVDRQAGVQENNLDDPLPSFLNNNQANLSDNHRESDNDNDNIVTQLSYDSMSSANTTFIGAFNKSMYIYLCRQIQTHN